MASRPEGAPGGSQDKETVRLNQIIQVRHMSGVEVYEYIQC